MQGPMQHTADLSIIIVSWNVRDLLAACLESIQRAACGDLAVETIVVDNASKDGTPAMIRETYPHVTLIEPGRNTGFTGGNNLGMEAATGRYFMLLNPDTEIIGDALVALTAYLESNPGVGVVGPQLLNPDGSVQSSRRSFPTLWTAIFESTWLQPIAPRRVLDRYYVRDAEDDAITPVDWVQGAAFVVRRTAVEAVGLFDEQFFMYSEELDWQRRLREAGWEVVYLPRAQVLHHGGKSSDQVVARRHIYFQSSKVRYFRKHHGIVAGESVRLALLLNYLGQLVLEAAKWLVGHRRALRRDRVAAYWQVLRSGLRG